MRYYPIPDTEFYVDIPNKWDNYCTYSEDKNWRPTKYQKKPKAINYYRDIEGSTELLKVKDKDLYLELSSSRINPLACLPVYYSRGERFIKLEKSKPLGFKCSPFPLSLQQVKDKDIELRNEAIKLQKQQEWDAKLQAECEKSGK